MHNNINNQTNIKTNSFVYFSLFFLRFIILILFPFLFFFLFPFLEIANNTEGISANELVEPGRQFIMEADFETTDKNG